jgi:hypothetical protein
MEDTQDDRINIDQQEKYNYEPQHRCKPQLWEASQVVVPITLFVKQPSSISLQNGILSENITWRKTSETFKLE